MSHHDTDYGYTLILFSEIDFREEFLLALFPRRSLMMSEATPHTVAS